MAKTGFYQSNTVVEETESSLSETATNLSSNDTKVKSSFYRDNSEYESVGNIWNLALLARIPIFIQGQMTNGELLARYIMVDDGLEFDSTNSEASAVTAATAETIISLKKNGTQFGTVTFAASGTDGAISGSTTFSTGDVLTVVAPATADITLGSTSITLAATRAV